MTSAPADAFASVLGALLFPAPETADARLRGESPSLSPAPAVPPSALVVAFSGGRDSTVLLHLARRYASAHGLPLRALHINHQLQDAAAAFVQHCDQICQAWGIALTVLPVQVNRSDKGLEADARAARYAAFADNLQAHELLLLGQHADDQIETLLLQLLRGAGPLGLASMATVAHCGNALLCRPLLQVRRDALAALAAQNQWRWIEDPSNTDHALARNRLRHELMPVLLAQREGAAEVLLRAVGWQAETVTLLADLAQLDAAHVQQDNGLLSRSGLLQLTPARQANLLRWWLQQQQLPAPNADRLQVFLQQLSAPSDQVLMRWGSQQLRVSADQLIALPDWSPGSLASLTWLWPEVLPLPQMLGQLSATPFSVAPSPHTDNAAALLLRAPRPNETVTLRWQTPGVRLALPGRQGRRELKDVFQAAQIPAWLRPLWPKLFYNDALVALPGLLVTVAGMPTALDAAWQLQGTGPLFTLAQRLQRPGAAAGPATR